MNRLAPCAHMIKATDEQIHIRWQCRSLSITRAAVATSVVHAILDRNGAAAVFEDHAGHSRTFELLYNEARDSLRGKQSQVWHVEPCCLLSALCSGMFVVALGAKSARR